MIPLPLLLVQLMLAVGGALLVGNVAVVLRHRLARDKEALPPRPPTRRLAFNIIVGAVVSLWAAATLVVRP
jgi:hypothetical protein